MGCAMHYFQFNIGDYASHTQRLSLLEDLAYRRLLDEYYLHEHPLNSGIASVARQIGMREYESEVKFVLEIFFQLTDQGWINKRADKEIAHFHSKIEQASKAGKASAERRFNDRSTDVQPNNNQQPITNNHKPKNTATKVATPEGVSESVWNDFVKHRKAKRAQITERVIDAIALQAKIAGWTLEAALAETTVRNWQTFKAEWVEQKPVFQNKFDISRTTTPARSDRDPALVKADQDLANARPIPLEVLAKMAALRKAVV
jgi:uncharacterized protein YdaU (DUF1376 family)